MNKFILLYSVLLLSMASASFSEVAIDRADFPLEANYMTRSLLEYKTELESPSIGDNQTWDLSDLVTTHYIEQEFFDAAGDEFYTNATNYRIANYPLNDFDIESKDFYVADEQGYTRIGRRITEVEYSIAQITGGANDKLKINGGNIPFESRLDFIKFPLEYQNTWTEGYNRVTNYELTVAAYGLNETPGVFISFITETRTVVGSGKLTIPNKDGGVMTIDALLIKAENTEVDSVFLGGQPAPVQLMDAFGLTQGNATNTETYIFYSPGYGVPVASVVMAQGYLSYAELSDIKTSVETEEYNTLNIYPTPVNMGQTITVDNIDNNISSVKLIDQTGKTVLATEVNGINSNFNLEIPNSLTTGVYLLQSNNRLGELVNTSKLIIE